MTTTVPFGAQADEQQAQQRRHRRVEPFRALLRRQASDFGQGVRLREAGEILDRPRQRGLAGHDLHRLARPAAAEARPQRAVPGEQRLPGVPQPVRVERPDQFKHPLPLVDVRAPVVEGGVEQQALLQG
ncbi:hypothetical protein SALBM135S_09489 [Streptomyces alboniger]